MDSHTLAKTLSILASKMIALESRCDALQEVLKTVGKAAGIDPDLLLCTLDQVEAISREGRQSALLALDPKIAASLFADPALEGLQDPPETRP